jgi:hypothetical protein
VPGTMALAIIGAGLAGGSFLGTMLGTRLRLRNPLLPQLVGLTAVAVAAVVAISAYALAPAVIVAVLCATGSAVAKLSLDSVLQRDLPEPVRGTGFAHSESLLQLAFVLGGALGLIPITGEWGLVVITVIAVGGAVWVGFGIWRLRSRPDEPIVVDVRVSAPSEP